MPRSFFQGPIAAVSVLALGVTVPLVGGTAATASLPGSGSVLTSSNGQTVLRFHGDPSRTSLSSPDTITGAAWSPDGSQAAYLDPGGRISKLRFDDGAVRYPVTSTPDAGVVRADPTWWADGSRVAWAEKASADGAWRIFWQYAVGPLRQGWITADDGKHYTNPDGGPGTQIVFQRQDDNGSGQPGGQSAVMVYDSSKLVGRVTLVDDNGSNPAISPDESRVAFVRAGRIVVSDLAGQNELTVTPDGVEYDDPTWSPDGGTLAFSRVTSTAARPVYTASADGSTAPVLVPGLDGVPAYQPRRKEQVARLSGANRFDTAVAVSRARWGTGGATGVVLARSDTYADALSGAALAAAKYGPLLLTPPTALDPTTKAEIQRVLLPGHGTVYLLGGTGALSTALEAQIRGLGYQVRRIAGADRYSTSVEIAKAIDPTPDTVMLATGMDYPDALAAGAAAGGYNSTPDSPFRAVVLLTRDEAIPPATKAYLDSLSDWTYLYGVGSQAVTAAYSYDAPEGTFVRGISGDTRYETAYGIALEFFEGQRYTGFASGSNWPDALTGGALMGALGGPLMLLPATDASVGTEAVKLLGESSGSVHTGLVFGAAALVSPAQQAQIGTWLGGPLGSNSVSNLTGLPPRRP